ncbi:hypothetical protein FBT96_13540 [Rhodobacter capsulatus]|uniref:NACHT domain-containing protein n=1 Tax=Rhodobacter capsulatus TaxID=1061 RepID=A0A4V5PP06_RHOCA|nr:hypothetical protein [Rhodobacter capsulatus]TKD17604.1 hypothetical protein FBT96_13540 [Rhodobacter capsulatus]
MSINAHLQTVKTGLLSLKAAGADGFEGLLRIALTNLTGIPFRLAASGLQGGMDGDAAMRTDPVCFEAKLYSGKIDRKDVIVKIADLGRREKAADRLWVLGATIEVSTQIAKDLEEDGDKNAISTLILDWTAAPLPLLAIAVVAADSSAIDFIVGNYDKKTAQKEISKEDLKNAFSSISAHPEFESLLQYLKSSLNVSKLSFKRAVDQNATWRQQTFGSTRHARERLGQGLAVQQEKNFPPMRTELRKNISSELATGKEVILLGDEGHGKSWLAAQLCSDDTGLALFISAEQLDGVSVHDLDDFLVDLLIKQTGEFADDALKRRWMHRLEAWRATPSIASLLVVVDGLNQRQNFRWDKLLNGIQSRLAEIRGRMVVTVRSHFWEKTIARGLAFRPKTFGVPEWSPTERDELLKHYGIALDWLDQKTLKTLKNPRLLAVAVATLPHRDAIAWKGLTTDRLLMEHLRASQLENYEDETFKQLTNRLSDHARKVLERVQASQNEPPQNFHADSEAVIETRFFRPLPGPGDLYELRDEGLTLALGFTLIDQLWQTHLANRDLSDRITQLVEPINAMDRTIDVIFASLLICALDNIRFDRAIFSVLLDAFANLQNVSEKRFEEFVEIIKNQPDALFDTLKLLCLESGRRINHDWLVHAAFMVSLTDEGWRAAETAIHHWLRCYHKDAAEQAKRYHTQGDADYAEKVEKRKAEIDGELASLCTFERRLLDQMTEVPSEPDDLISLALRLLAGHSLVPFAESFVAMGIAFALDRNIYKARKEFPQLTTFNRIDRAATRDAFRKAIEPLRLEESSKGGQWTVVRMLYASGDERDAQEASVIARELQKDWHHFEPPSPTEWRQVKVADPGVMRPSDMDQGVRQFVALDVNKMRQTMGVSGEDHNFGDFLPIAARFEPEAAVEKTRSILSGLLTRTGFPLRQVILNSEDHLPLIDADLAVGLFKRVQASNDFDTLPDQDQWICRAFGFYYCAGQISAAEQLRCMTDRAFGSDYLLSVIPSLKAQPTDEIASAIRDALQRNNEEAAYGALAAALYGQTQITGELEQQILACSRGASSKLRAVAYELATYNDLDVVRQAHMRSNWNAASLDEKTYEGWFGSMLLVEACAHGEMPVDDLLKRISSKTWFAASERLGKKFTEPMVACFVQRLRSAVVATHGIQPPSADLKLSKSEPAPFPFLSIEETDRDGERFPKQRILKDVLGGDDDFDEKRNKLNSVAKAFFEELNATDAKLLVQDIGIDNLGRLVREVPALLSDLFDILDQADIAQFVWLKNVAFAVANLISGKAPEHAVALLKRASSSRGFLLLALGDDLTLEHQAIWGGEVSEPMKALWRQRLLASENDAVLAREVLAAERFGAADFIKSMVLELAASEDSLDQAYAISIAGYSIRSGEFADILGKHIDQRGVSGQAAKNAFSEHEGAIWAGHWVESMWNAQKPEDFWRCLIIAKTSMDARVSPEAPTTSLWRQYAPVFRRARKSAIEDRNKEREKRLLGQETPEKVFITSVD